MDPSDPEIEKRVEPSSISPNPNPTFLLPTTTTSTSSSWFEIRLFYVRVSPCFPSLVPSHLVLSHPPREIGVALEINSARVLPSDPTSLLLRRDRLDSDAVTYVSTDAVRFTGPVEFEVRDNDEIVLCGAMEPEWGEGKGGWGMECYAAAAGTFVRPKVGITAPEVEVYVAGCCKGVPVILTRTVRLSCRRKAARQGMLDAIPESEERDAESGEGGSGRRAPSLVEEREIGDYDSEMKIDHGYYSGGQYYDDDGELSWFNAGVRVGVGIGLGMCLGVGIGVGLLMRSYQTTTRNFRRRFL